MEGNDDPHLQAAVGAVGQVEPVPRAVQLFQPGAGIGQADAFLDLRRQWQTGAAVRCALTRREENLVSGNRNSTIQRLVAGARSDGTLTALSGEYVNAIGWGGFSCPTYGPMEMLYDCENVRTQTFSTRLNTNEVWVLEDGQAFTILFPDEY